MPATLPPITTLPSMWPLAGFQGVWVAGHHGGYLPGQDWPFAGCEIGSTGYGVLLEVFYNPDQNTRRYGTGEFGSDAYGQFAGGPPTVKRWVDLTEYCQDINIARGQPDPIINTATDQLTFTFKDDNGDIFGWLPPAQLDSPQINDPVRVSIVEPDGTQDPLVTCTIDAVTELHGGTEVSRLLTVTAFGVKTALITALYNRITTTQQMIPRTTQQTTQRLMMVLDNSK